MFDLRASGMVFGCWVVYVVGVKRKYIEATYELLARDGLNGVSIRKIADEVGCSSTALYRHFHDIDKLTAVASVRFLRSYIDNARFLSQVELNPLELNLQLWECLAYYSFRNADVFENMFFGDTGGNLYPQAAAEYFEQYPEDLAGLKDFMLDMVQNTTITERDSILLNRAAEMGMLSPESAEYLCKVDSYLYHGMLASLRAKNLDDRGYREATKEFMQLLIRGYKTQLEEGFSILVVELDSDIPETGFRTDVRPSYRIEVVALKGGAFGRDWQKATA